MVNITLIQWLTVVIQVAAVILALRLIPLTKKAMAWSLLSLAFLLMASRRTLDLLFSQSLIDDPLIHTLSTQMVAFTISLLLLIGIVLIKRIFIQQQRDADQLKKLSLVTEQSHSASVIFTPDAMIEYVNPKYCELYNASPQQLIGNTPAFLTAEHTPDSTLKKIWNKIRIGGIWKGEFCDTNTAGKQSWSRIVISPITNEKEQIVNYIATLEDITIEKQQRITIKELSLHDALTQLPNKIYFNQSLQLAIKDAECRKQTIAVLLLDINNFKEINNTLGHLTGDVILREISSRLNYIASQNSNHSLARMGGDEFLLYTTNTTAEQTLDLANQMKLAVQQPLHVENRNFDLSVNIGFACFPEHASSADELIKCADVAMYAAKASSHSIVQYQPDLDDGKLKRLELSSHFRQAAEENEFILYFQPQMNFKDKKILGSEALIRWLHPEYGMIPPDEFIQLAEQSGHIYMITEWVISNAMAQLSQWHKAQHYINLSVNVSATDIQNPELVSLLETELIRNKLEPAFITLEITENSLMLYNKQTISALIRIAELGINISIDDFGTGYSSLQYLTKMPVSHIKIDKSFVMKMLQNDQDAIIVRSTIDMAHNLGLTITAEGIEDEDTLQILEVLRCDHAQGYHLARPMNNQDFIGWLEHYNSQLEAPITASLPNTQRV
ncbi:MAG: bifunctional diguanylate cyclase/phosphodiesterase [Gammaproteobacteria bacterium]|nr:bifunctional diguanylate cyclase/phosphodiesterase [Gammaproteobacteria bacterium]